MQLQGKVAMVTGAGRGIGGAIARGLAQAGADVVLISRTRAELEAQAEWVHTHTGQRALALPGDVSERDTAFSLADAARSHFEAIDILVNAAGVSVAGNSETLSEEDWRRCLAVNLDGTFFCCQAVGEGMIARGRGGKIINVTSIVAHAAIPRRAAYAASKGGVRQLTQNLAVEWGPYHIQVNSISPGYIRTELFDQYVKQGVHNPEAMVRRIPAGRMGTPEDVVGPAVFLASSASDYVTGVILVVDGGWLANGYT